MVIGLDYRKSPSSPFPKPIMDLESVILAALDDESLPIDKTRVGLAGWSAGGCLSLALAQRPSMRNDDGTSKIQALIPLYPIVDFTVSATVKAATRRYKVELGGFRARPRDYLEAHAPVLQWAYIPAGRDLTNPVISPYFADRNLLPKYIFFIGCELDMLAHEGWRMVSKLAGRDVPGPIVGQKEVAIGKLLIFDDPTFHFQVDHEDGHNYKWLLVPDTIHGFDMEIEGLVRDEITMADARLKRDKVIQVIGRWLFTGAFAGG
jgi:acetyl esterase/lipase